MSSHGREGDKIPRKKILMFLLLPCLVVKLAVNNNKVINFLTFIAGLFGFCFQRPISDLIMVRLFILGLCFHAKIMLVHQLS